MRKCKSCGSAVDKDANFCTVCGAKAPKGRGVLAAFLIVIGLLIIINNIGNIDDSGSVSAKPSQPVISEEEFKASCQEVNYKDLLRYPTEHIGDQIVVEVQLVQKVDDAWRAYSDTSGLGFFTDDEYYIVDDRADADLKLLAEDVVRVYGVCYGTKEVVRALTSTTDEVPWIKAEYIELISE